MSLPAATFSRAIRVYLLWVLALAVPVYGCSASMLSMLGPVHSHGAESHAQVGALDAEHVQRLGALAWLVKGWQAWEALGEREADSGATVFLHSHAHQHDGLQRHHHGPADVHDDLIIVGAGADGADSGEEGLAAVAGSAMPPFAVGRALEVPAAAEVACTMRHAGDAVWRNADRRRLDRPPQRLAAAMTDHRPTDKA